MILIGPLCFLLKKLATLPMFRMVGVSSGGSEGGPRRQSAARGRPGHGTAHRECERVRGRHPVPAGRGAGREHPRQGQGRLAAHPRSLLLVPRADSPHAARPRRHSGHAHQQLRKRPRLVSPRRCRG